MKACYAFLSSFLVCSILLQSSVWVKQRGVNAEQCSEANRVMDLDVAALTMKRLMDDLLCDYDKLVTPHTTNGSAIEIDVFLYVYRLDLDVKRAYLQMLVDMTWTWTDQRLSWDLSQYNLRKIVLTDRQIWIPDLEALNSMQREWNEETPLACSVSFEGEVTCNPVYTLQTTCGTSARHWPFDQHNCEFELASRNHDAREYKMRTTLNTTELMLHDTTSDEWSVVTATQKLEVLKFMNDLFEFNRLVIKITLARRSEIHVATVAVPALVLACLVLAQLWLDPRWPGRLLLGCTVVACSLLYIYYLSETVPDDTAGAAPLIVIFFRDTLYLGTFVVLLGVASRAVAERTVAPPLWLSGASSWLLRRVPGPAALLLADEALSNEASDGDAKEDVGSDAPKTDTSTHTVQWRRISKMLDRLFFVGLAITYVVMLIAFVP